MTPKFSHSDSPPQMRQRLSSGSMFNEVGIFSGDISFPILFIRSPSEFVILALGFPPLQNGFNIAPVAFVRFDSGVNGFNDPLRWIILLRSFQCIRNKWRK